MAGPSTIVSIGANFDSSFNSTFDKAEGRMGKLGSDLLGGGAGGSPKRLIRRLEDARDANLAMRKSAQMNVASNVALGYAMYRAVKPAVEFESAMANVRKVMTFTDQKNGMKILTEGVIGLSKVLPMTMVEIADLTAAGGRMGLNEKDVLAYTRLVGMMSTAWELNAETTGIAIGRIMGATNSKMGDMGLIGDAINKLDDTSSVATAEDIIDILARTGGLAKPMGITIQQLAALGTAMVDLGAGSERGSSAMIDLFSTLKDAPQLNKTQLQGWKLLGIDPKKLQKKAFKNGIEAIRELQAALMKLDPIARNTALTELFGSGLQKENISKFLLNGQVVEDALTTVADKANYAGSVIKEFEVRMATTATQMKLAGNALTRLSVAISPGALAGMQKLGGWLTPIVDKVSALAKEYPELMFAIVQGAGSIVIAKNSIAALGYFLNLFKGGVILSLMPVARLGRLIGLLATVSTVSNLRALGPAMLAAVAPTRMLAGSMRLLKLAVISTGVGAILVALTALGTWIWNNQEGLGEAFKGFGEGIRTSMGPAYEVIRPMVDYLGKASGFLWNMTDAVNMSLPAWRQLGIDIGTSIGNGLKAVIDTINEFIAALTAAYNKVMEVVRAIKELTGLGDNMSIRATAGATAAKKYPPGYVPPGGLIGPVQPTVPKVSGGRGGNVMKDKDGNTIVNPGSRTDNIIPILNGANQVAAANAATGTQLAAGIGAHAALMAAEKPRTITNTVNAPMNFNITAMGDPNSLGAQVAAAAKSGVEQGAKARSQNYD